MKKEIEIVVSSRAREKYKERAFSLSQKLDTRLDLFRKDILSETEFPEILVVCGGDGTIRSLTQEILENNRDTTLVIMPAGTNNILYRTIKQHAVVASEEELLSGNFEVPRFKPGIIGTKDSELLVFNHLAGLNEIAAEQPIVAEKLRRFVPRDLRKYLAGLTNVVLEMSKKENLDYILRIAVTNPCSIIPVKVNQDLYSDTVSLISIEGGDRTSIFKKILMLYTGIWAVGKLPEKLVKIEQKESFVFKGKIDKLNLDGDLIQVQSSGDIFVARAKKGIRAAALELKGIWGRS